MQIPLISANIIELDEIALINLHERRLSDCLLVTLIVKRMCIQKLLNL